MKLTVYHSDPEVLAAMAQMLTQEFHPPVLILDPDSSFPSGEGPESQSQGESGPGAA